MLNIWLHMKVRSFIALSNKSVSIWLRMCFSSWGEDAPICKYCGSCMFKHEELEEDKKESDVDDTINDDDNQDEDGTSDI